MAKLRGLLAVVLVSNPSGRCVHGAAMVSLASRKRADTPWTYIVRVCVDYSYHDSQALRRIFHPSIVKFETNR